MNKFNNKKKRFSYRLLSNLLLAAAILMLNYPLIADIANTGHQERLFSDYIDTVSETDVDEIYEEIDEYNSSLIHNEGRFLTEKTSDAYSDILNVQGSVMAYIDIPSAGVSHLPVRHYASAESLQASAGHVAGSSLPSDGKGVHTCISAHNGMSGQKGFSSLTSVKMNDTFNISFLDKVLTYQVFRIKTVDPDDTSLLEIDPDANFCTLITCVPLGINSHRLCVTGYLLSEENINSENVSVNASTDLTHRFSKIELGMSGVSVLLFGLLMKDLVKYLKKRNRDYEIDFIYLDEDDDLINAKEAFRQAIEAYYK